MSALPQNPRRAAAWPARTKYPKSIQRSDGSVRILKSASNNRKLGGTAKSDRITRGPHSGALFLAWTGIERSAGGGCPASCPFLTDGSDGPSCYGDAMALAHRFRWNKSVQRNIKRELREHFKIERRIVIRWGVLGDVIDDAENLPGTVAFLRELMDEFTGLRIFGYSAHAPETQTGRDIAALNRDYARRCIFRFSLSRESSGEHSYAAQEGFVAAGGRGFLCPEQRHDAQDKRLDGCYACGLCLPNSGTKLTVEFSAH